MVDASVWPGLIGAGIGAGGAVFAQIISASFTARRENSRLLWEKEKHDRELSMRESERFVSLKQELYSRYISLTYDPINKIMRETDREYVDEPDWQERMPQYNEELTDLRSNIRLVGPPVVYERVEYSHAAMLGAMFTAMSPTQYSLEKRRKNAQDALRAWQQVSNAMRADLRGDEKALHRISESVAAEHRQKLSAQPLSNEHEPE